MTELNRDEQIQILKDGFDACIRNHLCGNYISVWDIDGIENQDIAWDIDTDDMMLIAYTEYGVYRFEYDFDFSFDENLNSFYDGLIEYLINKGMEV